jgi:hypothetical protein
VAIIKYLRQINLIKKRSWFSSQFQMLKIHRSRPSFGGISSPGITMDECVQERGCILKQEDKPVTLGGVTLRFFILGFINSTRRFHVDIPIYSHSIF